MWRKFALVRTLVGLLMTDSCKKVASYGFIPKSSTLLYSKRILIVKKNVKNNYKLTLRVSTQITRLLVLPTRVP